VQGCADGEGEIMAEIEIRESAPGDLAPIEGLYREAFPQEDLLPLVGALLKEGESVLSLVAVRGGALVGHGAFTIGGVEGGSVRVALLGPLAVAPGEQQQGIGSAIVRAGLKRLERDGVASVFALGDPAYYGRFGFAPETQVAPPYAVPQEWRDAWQSLSLGSAIAPEAGTLCVPPPWRRPALWAP
jgi:putative acetyltransferase